MADEGSEGRRTWLWVSLALLAIVVFYVLSVGPAAMIADRTGSNGEVYTTVYAPLWWLDRTPLGEPLSRYIDLWLD